MVHALVAAAALTGEGRYREAAEEALGHRRRARRAGAAVRRLVAGRRRGAGGRPARGRGRRPGRVRRATLWSGRARRAPGVTVVVAPTAGDDGIPLLRRARAGRR